MAEARAESDFHPAFLVPLTVEEEAHMNRVTFFFPSRDAIEPELQAALKEAQYALNALKDCSLSERQQAAISLGCRFHYDIVRIHPFNEGAKRLGRLCMYIINAQQGVKPCPIKDGPGYIRALIENLKKNSHEAFEQFIRAYFEQEKTVKDSPSAASRTHSKKLSTNTPAAAKVPAVSNCAHCGKE